MKLHTLLKSRFSIAEKYTKDFHDEVKRCIKDYKADSIDASTLLNIDYVETVNRRYEFVAPLIFTNHEGMLASMFDRPPELIFNGRGRDDTEKAAKIKAAYSYIVDKLSVESFMNEAAWWFILLGFSSASASYKKTTTEIPMIDEETGEKMLDIDGNPVMRTVYDYDDPILFSDDPKKKYWSPESEFSERGDKVPYSFTKQLLSVDEVKETWNKTVKSDAVLEVEKMGSEDKKKMTDLKRVQIYHYYGTVPKDNKGEVQEWEFDAYYHIVYCDEKIIFKDKLFLDGKSESMCKLVKWYGPPNEFFGFGVAKVLRQFQKEKSIRRGQQIRYADIAAFPKLAMEQNSKIDIKAWTDPRENVVAMYNEKPPEYVSPPDLSNVLTLTEQSADQDAQQASGMIDISQGSQQSSTVKTATGQSIFAEAAEKRMRLAKKKFTRFYREVIIMLLKLAKDNWDSEKEVSITDEDGNEQQGVISAADLQDIDFDTDIDIDAESLTVNRDVLRQQAIELYDRVKDDPIIERRAVFKDMIRDGFNKKDPERYIKESGVEPGTQLINPQTGEAFMVDESGELINQQQQQELSNSQGGANDIPSDQAGVVSGPFK